MALNTSEITKVNDLYKELDKVRNENTLLTESLARLETVLSENDKHNLQHKETLSLLNELLTLVKKKK
jgi:hypothetical protein